MLSSKVAFASSQRKRDGRSSIRGTPLGVCRQGRHEVAILRVAVQRSHVPIMDVDDEDKRPFICAIFTGENFSALKPGEQRRVVLLEVTVQQEDQMRVLAVLFGVGTAVGIAASVSAAPNESSIQLAQAQDAGTQSGAVPVPASAVVPVTAKAAPRSRAVRRSAARRRGSPAMARRRCGARPLVRVAPPFVSVPGARASPCMAVRVGWSVCAPRPATMPL